MTKPREKEIEMDRDDRIKELQDENAELRHANEGESNRLSVAELVNRLMAVDDEIMAMLRTARAQRRLLDEGIRDAHAELRTMRPDDFTSTVAQKPVERALGSLRDAINNANKARKQ